MSAARFVASVIGALSIAGCGSIEDTARTTGVPRQQALEIRSALVAEKHAHTFYSYQRQEDGTIIVSTDVGSFKASRARGRWEFTPVGFVGAATS